MPHPPRGWRSTVLGCLTLALAACGGSEVILRTPDGRGVTAAQIDQEPLWLLPPGGLAYVNVDTQRANSSAFGERLLAELDARLPLPASAGFSRERDLSALHLATYSMQGIDIAGVARGHFDAKRIEAAASEYREGLLSDGLQRSEYAGRVLFTAHGVGFAIVTPRTAVFGSESGIRRCLDRIADGRLNDDLPSWAKELAASPEAAYSVGVDLRAGAVATAVARRLTFLEGATLLRGVGNFDPPGVHLAGTVSHEREQQAREGVQGLLAAGGSANLWGRLLGLGQPIQKLEAQSSGTDNQFVLALDGNALLTLMARFLPAPPPQSTSPSKATRAGLTQGSVVP